MSDIIPRLDTIEFDQLVEQARGDIPRYAPAWTDHNLHDPGMTLIDLLAWIVDQQIYRTGFVGGRHHRAFAALLGRRSEGPEPARGLIWPKRGVAEGRLIVAGSKVICLKHRELSFVLERSIYLSPAVLVSLDPAVDGVELPAPSSQSDYGSWILGDSGSTASAVLTLHFDQPLGLPTDVASVSLGISVAAPPGPSLSPESRPWGPVIYSYRIGAAQWVELDVVHDGTAGMAMTGAVILAIPPAGAAETGRSELRLSFDRGFFPVPPQIRFASINVIPVVQLELVRSAPLLPLGTGQPDQMVELDTSDLVTPPSRPKGPVLEVEVVSGPDAHRERWAEQADFSRSGPGDLHYVVRPGHLLFGNGLNGRRPENGAQISHTELARTRGAAGNVRRNLFWSVPALGAIGSDFGLNHEPLTGGKDATGIEDLARAARDAAARRSALLTDNALSKAACELAGMAVGRAEVLAGFDRRLPDRKVEGVRTLVVLPQQPVETGSDQLPGLLQPTQAYLDEVAARLDELRVLGERLIVQGPVVVYVNLALTITTEPGAVAEEIKTAVKRAIQGKLSAVAGSDAVQPWPLGRDLTISEVQGIAANVPGVRIVSLVQVATTGDALGAGPVQVPPDGLVVADDIKIIAEPTGFSPVDRTSQSDDSRGST